MHLYKKDLNQSYNKHNNCRNQCHFVKLDNMLLLLESEQEFIDMRG